MTQIPFSSLITLFPCFILLLISCIIPIPSDGLKITLVPPHSPESPAYLGNLTMSKKIKKLINQSRCRAQVLSSSLLPTRNSNKILRPPVEGINLGGADGYVYAAKIGIGIFNENPPYKTYYLAVDTGSTLTWLQCEDCQTAGNTCYPQVDPLFQKSLSQTFEPIREDNDLCTSAPPNPNPSNMCYYDEEYGDGSRSKGQMAVEIFSFESDTPKIFQTDIVFGCGYDQRDFVVSPSEPEKAAGILGLGRGKEAFHVQLDFHQIGGRFSYCFQDLLNQGGGPQRPTYMSFLDDIQDDPSTFQATTFQVVPQNPLYCVRLISIKIGNTLVSMFPEDRVIIDSGTSISYLVKPIHESLVNTLKSWLNGRRSNPRILQANDLKDEPTFCFVKTPSQGYEILPTIHFILEGGGDFEIKPQQGFEVWKEDPQGEEYFCLMIEPHETLSIIGAFQQANHRLIYDTYKNKLFFKSDDCANNP